MAKYTYLPTYLIRFHSYKTALISDMKQAFLNVSVKESDPDFYDFYGLKTSVGTKLKLWFVILLD